MSNLIMPLKDSNMKKTSLLHLKHVKSECALEEIRILIKSAKSFFEASRFLAIDKFHTEYHCLRIF